MTNEQKKTPEKVDFYAILKYKILKFPRLSKKGKNGIEDSLIPYSALFPSLANMIGSTCNIDHTEQPDLIQGTINNGVQNKENTNEKVTSFAKIRHSLTRAESDPKVETIV
ncbi:Oidioi.mRNA.OKI2018_I69.PAR.g9368.t1.cds [Oikopleura dioica]|uniref:Oidioi.mRNA.OKI2018_I69.PAR.g9368.t1.cds n=1 Tax=Oikopleura dioica TaxID=34765 RepID=A0ABN7RPD1_OIKDI|nr:Oidioi.mRNA.OKI2018_I69.PAR.g9368.t1.cds [Oikopleura dioica]